MKVFVILVRDKRLDLRYFVTSGGMPSAHSAIVCALATAVAMTHGIGSVTFGIAVVLALIVTYDSAGVRQSVSQQSVVLNRIVQELRFKRPIAEVERDCGSSSGIPHFRSLSGRH